MELSPGAVDGYWSEKGLAVKEVLASLAERQTWAVDGDADIAQWVELLGTELRSPEFARAMAASPTEVAELLAWLRSPVAMRILDAIDEAEAGSAAKVILAARAMQGNHAYRLFVDAVDILTKARLLAKIFSPQRMAAIEAAVYLSRGDARGGGSES